MADDFRVEGLDELTGLAKVMRKVGDGKEIRKALLAGLREAGRPTATEMRDRLGASLPKRGGLSKTFTKKKKLFAVRNRLSGEEAGVRILSTEDRHDYASLEQAGKLRHPKHPGHRPRRSWRWDEQKVPTQGVLEGVLAEHRNEFVDGIEAAMIAAAEAVEQAIDREG